MARGCVIRGLEELPLGPDLDAGLLHVALAAHHLLDLLEDVFALQVAVVQLVQRIHILHDAQHLQHLGPAPQVALRPRAHRVQGVALAGAPALAAGGVWGRQVRLNAHGRQQSVDVAHHTIARGRRAQEVADFLAARVALAVTLALTHVLLHFAQQTHLRVGGHRRRRGGRAAGDRSVAARRRGAIVQAQIAWH